MANGDGFDHMIATTEADRVYIHRLAKAVGKKPSRAVELAIDWSLDHGVSPAQDANFRPKGQIHVVLSKNYRERLEASAIAYLLHFGLANYWGNYGGGVPEGDFRNIRFVDIDQPETAVLAFQRRAFGASKDIEVEYGARYKQAILSLMETLPKHHPPESDDPRVSVRIPTDHETRALYLRLNEQVEVYNWDVDTLIERRLAELSKVP